MPVLFSSLFIAIIPLAFLIFAWTSVGTPKLLKRTAMLAVIVPLFHLLILLFAGAVNVLKFFVKDAIVCFIPFLCVFFNARRFDKSLSFARALMFWLPE
jgi:hypothetical protein